MKNNGVAALNSRMRTQLNKRLKTAQGYLRKYAEKNAQIDGAILVGSTNIGVIDKYADIDIIIVAPPEAVAARKAMGKGYNETYVHESVEICIDWHPLAEIKKELENWKNDATLWSLSKANILLDKRGVIRRLLGNIKPYPKEVRKKKLFLRFYWLSYYLNIIETSIKRREYETAAYCVYSSVKELSEILFLIENQFIPIEKWRFHELKKLRIGREFLPRIQEVMRIARLTIEELEDKLTLLRKMHDELKQHLVKAGVEKERIGPDWWRFEPDWNVG